MKKPYGNYYLVINLKYTYIKTNKQNVGESRCHEWLERTPKKLWVIKQRTQCQVTGVLHFLMGCWSEKTLEAPNNTSSCHAFWLPTMTRW